MESKLTPLQRQILAVLRGFDPRWTLTGGGALAGFHLGHRATRDLDLFFHGLSSLDTIPLEIEGRLREAGLGVATLRSAPTFRRLEVRSPDEVILVDLVAEPVPELESPVEVEAGIWVDTQQEILVNKLCALLGRVAIRDLLDVQTLVATGADLEKALALAPLKDAGFSPPTLAWLLKELPVASLARQAGYDPVALVHFRDQLVDRLLS